MGHNPPLAIYRWPGGTYIVKEWRGIEARLWCRLGPAYTREIAQALAVSLTQDERPSERKVSP